MIVPGIVLGIATAVSREIEASQRIEILPEIEIRRTTGIFQGIGVEVFPAGEVSRRGEEEIIVIKEKIHLTREDFKTVAEVHLETNIRR